GLEARRGRVGALERARGVSRRRDRLRAIAPQRRRSGQLEAHRPDHHRGGAHGRAAPPRRARLEAQGVLMSIVLAKKIPIVTVWDIPGYEIEKVLGTVWGLTVRSRSVVGQTVAGCQMFFGGEVSALTELATESRIEAMNRLEKNALALGADAVVMLQFDSGELMQNTNEIIAYGTAVKLRPAARG